MTCVIGRMKLFKADGIEATSSDILINACTELHVHLGLLLNSMLIHGISPCNLLISTLVPIPKNKNKSLNYSDNYRAIALGSVVGKVIDRVLFSRNIDIYYYLMTFSTASKLDILQLNVHLC